MGPINLRPSKYIATFEFLVIHVALRDSQPEYFPDTAPDETYDYMISEIELGPPMLPHRDKLFESSLLRPKSTPPAPHQHGFGHRVSVPM